MKYIDYNEKKKHGKPEFPIQYYYVSSSHEQYCMPLHWHRELELIRVIKGSLEIYLNNELFTLTSGKQLLICGGTLHRGIPYDCIYECAVFDPAMLCKHKNDIAGQYILPIINGTVSIAPNACNNAKIAQTVTELFDTLKANTQELKVYSLLFQLFYLLYSENLAEKTVTHISTKKQSDNVNKMLQCIQENYLNGIKLEELSHLTGLNEKYICKLFKKYTSMTPIEYANSLKIEHACDLMTHSDLSVTDSALESGFNDLSYFSRIFKRIKGETPKEYKKQHTP